MPDGGDPAVAYRAPGRCPVCAGRLEVARLQCPECGTAVEGQFEGCPFCALTPEQQRLVMLFLRVRGNIREVERELGVSYPTVRARLDGIAEALGLRVEPEVDEEEERRRIRRETLAAVERGELAVEEAVRRLREL